MNTNILKKCVDELKKPEPKIDYVLGMLESVIELSGNTETGLIGGGSIRLNDSLARAIPASEGSGLDTSIPESYVTTPGPIAKFK